ncbi:MAG: ankyrin repeat domain-containing protein [Methylotenera sp.]|nr:ankyrin repeat domain-containing protein [Methylotenera sp.]
MRTAFQRISPQHASDLILRARAGIKPLALFDSRDAASFQKSHILGTDHLTECDFGEVIANLPKSVPVMIYCYHGNASQVYASMFADFQYNEVYSVDGGYEALVPAFSEVPALNAQSSYALAEFIAEHHFEPEDLNSPWHHALTPLMRAALFGREDLVAELLTLGVNIHMRNLDGNNALWLACVSGNTAIVKLLLEAGIDIDNRNVTGATTLMYTASSGKHDLAKVLLDNGADPFIRNDDDFLAIELAASEECLRLLRHTAS